MVSVPFASWARRGLRWTLVNSIVLPRERKTAQAPLLTSIASPLGGIGRSLKVIPKMAFLIVSRLTPQSRESLRSCRSPDVYRKRASRSSRAKVDPVLRHHDAREPARGRSVAAANPARYRAPSTVLFLNGDVSTILTIGTVAPITRSVTPPLLICPLALRLPALTPTLTTLIFLPLRITNTNLRPTIWTDAELE